MRINGRIRVREVMAIGPDGAPLGVVPTAKALAIAQTHGLDLVEVSPTANPPVCKILDFGKYLYELAKRERESKKHQISSKLKELKFHVNTDAHDFMVKMRHAEDFLFKGMKVKLLIVLRGREMMLQDAALQKARRIIAELEHVATADQDPKLVGRNVNIMLTPLPVQRRSRKLTAEEPEEEPSGTVA
ncbi:MAG: translation initiation factor IF-3 [Bdellovibrionaceae bacterium]|nr:translation initiation factor IF-3 [Pseudobdellovibrionaceae bacterium]